jgi:hypothetical protein
MKPIATIKFQEVGTDEECVAIIRAASGSVAVALSRESDGDVEVVLPTVQARELSRALSAALGEAEQAAE